MDFAAAFGIYGGMWTTLPALPGLDAEAKRRTG
jgi:hypothetical protein